MKCMLAPGDQYIDLASWSGGAAKDLLGFYEKSVLHNHLFIHYRFLQLSMATSEPFCLHWMVWVTSIWLLFPAILLVGIFPHDLLPNAARSQSRQSRRSRRSRKRRPRNEPAASDSSSAPLLKTDKIVRSSPPTRFANPAYREAIAWQLFQLFLVWVQISCCNKLAACHPAIPDANTLLTVGFKLLNGGLVLYSLLAFLIWPRSTSD
jgi:hypothetical protein